jgi:thymidylate synthase
MNSIDKQYTDLLQDILDNGVTKQDRTGTGTISVFGRQIRHNMKDGFPLLTTKKMPWKTIVTELLWFLRGDTNIKFLVDNNCHIWDGDAYKNYINNPAYKAESVADLMGSQAGQLVKCSTQEEFINKIKTDDEFAKKWGELGKIYGFQWRKWREGKYTNELVVGGLEIPDGPTYWKESIDQIQNLINELKTNPDSRRLMVNAWNVGELDQMVLPPCHYGFQVYTRELSELERHDIKEQYGFDCRKLAKPSIKQLDDANIPIRAISLMWNQRSVDTFLGLPFNIASYGLLLEIIAKEVNMVPDQLIGNLGDVHLYSNHIEQAKEQIGREMTLEERTNYGIDVLGYNGLLDYGHSQNDDDKILEFLEMCGDVPTRTREPFPLPTFDCPAIDEIPHTTFDELVFKLQPEDFYMDDYQSHPTIKAPLSN